MAITDRVAELVTPLLVPLDLHLYDVELNGGTLRITVDADGGLNLDQLAQATKAISRAFDEDDADPMPGKYTLEVSSPGLERRLRTPEHFAAAVGEQVTIKLGPHVEGLRRITGKLDSIADGAVVISDENDQDHVCALVDVTKASTVFEWGPGPKPGHPKELTSKPKPGAHTAAPESERIAPAR